MRRKQCLVELELLAVTLPVLLIPLYSCKRRQSPFLVRVPSHSLAMVLRFLKLRQPTLRTTFPILFRLILSAILQTLLIRKSSLWPSFFLCSCAAQLQTSYIIHINECVLRQRKLYQFDVETTARVEITKWM